MNKERALLQAARELAGDTGSGDNATTVQIRGLLKKLQAYSKDQEALVDSAMLAAYEIKITKLLPKDFKGRKIAHEIPGSEARRRARRSTGTKPMSPRSVRLSRKAFGESPKRPTTERSSKRLS